MFKLPGYKMDPKEINYETVGRIYLAQDMNQCRALVNTILKFDFHKRRGIY